MSQAYMYAFLLLIWSCGIGVGYSLRGMVDRKRAGKPVFPRPSQPW